MVMWFSWWANLTLPIAQLLHAVAQSGLGIVLGSDAVVLLSKCPCKSLWQLSFMTQRWTKQIVRKNQKNALKKEIPEDKTSNSEK